MAEENLIVRGAREHNLQNVDVEIPRDQLTVITGLSGSGKSSLAFDTIYAEGQRRYVESLSAYARQFLGMMEKPDVDSIEGLSPAISIEQKTAGRNPRSTVGTVTEVYDYLRLLWARAGTPHCPSCGKPVERQSATQIVDRLMDAPGGHLAGGAGPGRARPQGRVPRPVRGDAPQGLYPRPHGRRRPPAGGAARAGPPRQPRHRHLRGAQGGGGRGQPLPHRRRRGDGAALGGRRGAGLRPRPRRAATWSRSCSASTTPARSAASTSPSWSRGSSPSTPRTAPARRAAAWGRARSPTPSWCWRIHSLSILEGVVLPWGVPRGHLRGTILQGLADALGFDLNTPWEELPDDIRQVLMYGVEGTGQGGQREGAPRRSSGPASSATWSSATATAAATPCARCWRST